MQRVQLCFYGSFLLRGEGRKEISQEYCAFSDLIFHDYILQIFNDNMLEINVKRCIRTAIKLRKKYFNKASPELVNFLYLLLIKEGNKFFANFFW